MKYFQIFKKILPYLALVALLIFVNPRFSGDFASIGWWLLVVILISRPLFQVFPRFGFLRYVIMLRRELGILSASFLLAHGAGYFLGMHTSILTIFTDATLWNFSRFIAWGLLGFIVSIPLLLTSNNYSLKLLGAKWKLLQRLSYVMFLAGATHFAMARAGDRPMIISIVSIWVIMWILAYKRVVLWKKSQ